MATETKSTKPAKPAPRSGLIPFRITVDQFLKLIDAGVFADADVELLGGRFFAQMTKNDPHDSCVSELGESLKDVLPKDWRVREEKSVVLGRFWRPEPDIAVVRGPLSLYRRGAPKAADLAMLIEVADSTYAKDRGVKWRRYASCGVPIYWIVNLNTRRVEVYSSPTGRGASAAYRDSHTHGEDAEVPVVIEGREVGRIAVKDILP